jgi:hypothetical protein
MPPAPLDLAARARGTLLGALAGGGHSPLLEILAEELAQGHTDLRRLADRWVERAGRGPVGDEETTAALAFLAEHGVPPTEGGRGSAVLGRLAPVALVAYRSPRTLVSATFHIAALTHPAPEAAWGAVAVNVALARLLAGTRDFIADVIEALAGNGAPDTLLAAVRRVPLARADAMPGSLATEDDAVAGVVLALTLAYHEPVAARAFARLGRNGAGAAAGALLGARDGPAAVPAGDAAASAQWAELAERLIRRTPAAAGHSHHHT